MFLLKLYVFSQRGGETERARERENPNVFSNNMKEHKFKSASIFHACNHIRPALLKYNTRQTQAVQEQTTRQRSHVLCIVDFPVLWFVYDSLSKVFVHQPVCAKRPKINNKLITWEDSLLHPNISFRRRLRSNCRQDNINRFPD